MCFIMLRNILFEEQFGGKSYYTSIKFKSSISGYTNDFESYFKIKVRIRAVRLYCRAE